MTTKTSSYFSRFGKGFFAVALAASPVPGPSPIGYAPFGVRDGSLQEHVEARNPWYGFAEQGALLWSTRVQRVADGDCTQWAKALVRDRLGEPLPDVLVPAEKWSGWQPWKGKDKDSVLECDVFPCAVKLNTAETQTMARLPEEKRWEKFHEMVLSRAKRYLATGERKEYEFPGDPADPWAFFEKVPLALTGVARPATPHLLERQTDFLSGSVHVLRQIVDWRAAAAADGKEASAWVRDAYTDHYFDGWGEWTGILCENRSAGKGVLVSQALLVELDLMKKNDLLSRLGRGNMRAAVEKQGKIFLENGFKRLEKMQATP